MTITVKALREHPRRAGRYVVDLDGAPDGHEKVGPLDVAFLGEVKLAVGAAVSDETLAALESAARRVACYDKALDALARRARSRADLGRWLRQREFTGAEIEPALEKLTELGLLDDLEFARGFARTRMSTGRGFGPRRVAAELSRRGVPREIADQVLAEVAGEEGAEDESAVLDALVAKRLKGMKDLDPNVVRRRLYGWLARRGFGPRAIRDAVQRHERGSER